MSSVDTYHGPFGPSTQAKTYDNLNSKVANGTVLNINGSKIPVGIDVISPAPVYNKQLAYSIKDQWGNAIQKGIDGAIPSSVVSFMSKGLATGGNITQSGLSKVQDGIGTVTSPLNKGVVKVNEYLAPGVESLKNFERMGNEFDKAIKDTFLGQVFNIKGTELICTAFCIVVSFLDCSTRNKLADTIQAIKAGMTAINATVAEVNNMTATINATLVAGNNIAQTASNLVGATKATELLSAPFKPTPIGMTGMGAVATILAAPVSVGQIVKNLSNIMKIFSKARIGRPVNFHSSIWDLAQSVLFALQAQAVNLADETLNKIIKPVEMMLKKMQPQECVGNLASVLFNKVIDAIRRFKQWVLTQIAELFAANNAHLSKHSQAELQSKSLLELQGLLRALTVVLSHFSDLALACGISKCNDQSDKVKKAVQAGQPIPMTNTPANSAPISALPKKPIHLDEIANKLAPILKLPTESIITGPNTFQAIIPGYENVPRKIAQFIGDGSLARELGPAYTIYDNGAKIVYTYQTTCGE